MATKYLLLDEWSDNGDTNLTLLTGSSKDEAIYAEFHYINENNETDHNIIELAVNLDQMKDMRNFLDKIIKKCEKNYGV